MTLPAPLLFAALALPLSAPATRPAAPPATIGVGTSLSDGEPLMVVDLQGKEIDLRAGLVAEGKDERRVTLLVFWGSWCHPCIEEIPVLNEQLKFYGPRGLRVQGVGLDLAEESPAKLSEAVRRHGIAYPVLFDANDVVRRRFGLTALPAAALVDAAGRVVWSGRRLPSDLSARLRAALIPDGDGEPK